MKQLLITATAFLTCAVVAGFFTYRVISHDSQRTYELLEDMQYLSEVDFFVRLLGVSNEDIRCYLSKAAASSSKHYAEFDFGESPRFGPNGLASVARENRDEVIGRYSRLNIGDYAKECVPQEGLYFKDSEQ